MSAFVEELERRVRASVIKRLEMSHAMMDSEGVKNVADVQLEHMAMWLFNQWESEGGIGLIMSLKPDRAYQAVPPGETIRELMGYWHPAIQELATSLNMCTGDAANLLEGNLVIDDSIAQHLSETFRQSKQFWLNLQAQYDEAKEWEKK